MCCFSSLLQTDFRCLSFGKGKIHISKGKRAHETRETKEADWSSSVFLEKAVVQSKTHVVKLVSHCVQNLILRSFVYLFTVRLHLLVVDRIPIASIVFMNRRQSFGTGANAVSCLAHCNGAKNFARGASESYSAFANSAPATSSSYHYY